MRYTANFNNGNLTVGGQPADELTPPTNPNGLTVVLRRLANPHLPADSRLTIPDAMNNQQPNPNYNPYITVDYLERIKPYDATAAPVTDASSGKSQPYASDPSQVANQTAGGNNTKHTWGQKNTNAAAASQWLVHLDRTPVSPMELLYVSGFRPHELTHKFINPAGTAQQHRVPWFDEDLSPPMNGPPPSHRLWRLFSFLEVADRAARISPRGRTPGKLNINTIWEFEVFQALCDASASNAFTPTDVQNMWNALVASRTPGLGTNRIGPGNGQVDRPFLELAGVGHLLNTDPQAALVSDPNTPVNKGRGLEDTIFRLQDPNGAANSPRLFQVVNPQTSAHPYLQYDMLTKVYNNLTTRSNTFGVWLTVGFFKVEDDTTIPVKLGAEIGASTGTYRRHSFFGLIDRTQIVLSPRLATSATAVGQAQLNQPQWITVDNFGGNITYSGSGSVPWSIQPQPLPGSILVVDRGTAQEETVVVTQVDPPNKKFQATFLRPHSQGFGITIPGNPGPQPGFDPTSPDYLPVVPYWETLQ